MPNNNRPQVQSRDVFDPQYIVQDRHIKNIHYQGIFNQKSQGTQTNGEDQDNRATTESAKVLHRTKNMKNIQIHIPPNVCLENHLKEIQRNKAKQRMAIARRQLYDQFLKDRNRFKQENPSHQQDCHQSSSNSSSNSSHHGRLQALRKLDRQQAAGIFDPRPNIHPRDENYLRLRALTSSSSSSPDKEKFMNLSKKAQMKALDQQTEENFHYIGDTESKDHRLRKTHQSDRVIEMRNLDEARIELRMPPNSLASLNEDRNDQENNQEHLDLPMLVNLNDYGMKEEAPSLGSGQGEPYLKMDEIIENEQNQREAKLAQTKDPMYFSNDMIHTHKSLHPQINEKLKIHQHRQVLNNFDDWLNIRSLNRPDLQTIKDRLSQCIKTSGLTLPQTQEHRVRNAHKQN